MIRDLRSEHTNYKTTKYSNYERKTMTNTNNESIIIYKEKFISADVYTKNLISDLTEKYGLQDNEATKIALGSFMAYGQNKFKVEQGKFDVEVLMVLLRYGVLYKYDNEPDTYRLWQPNDLTSFRTVHDEANCGNPWVTTNYRVTYQDGSHIEIPEDQIVESFMPNQYVQ